VVGAAVMGAVLLGAAAPRQQNLYGPVRPEPGEAHLRNILQLTFGGQNAEAYFSASGGLITFQSTRDALRRDQ